MSDDESVGGSCCRKPRSAYLAVLAVFLALYGAYNLIYYALTFFTHGFDHVDMNACHGPRCADTLTCDATRRSSFNLRVCVLTLGSLVFGVRGFNAIVNQYPSETLAFGFWLAATAALLGVVFFFDTIYYYTCGQQYSYNVIAEILLFPIKKIPVNGGIKYELRQLDTFPAYYIDREVDFHVLKWYDIVEWVKIFFFLHAAQTALTLAERFHYGIAGMGANFNIGNWRRRLLLRQELDQMYGSEQICSFMTQEPSMMIDGFDEGRNYQACRPPLNRGMGSSGMAWQWYPGRMPDPRAYDGFKDDRANVLL